ncbi:MAG TPA: hypothetical protein PJ982_19225, partial [Lacipirellulaceae bacterium]|nr:hypothetical protein [Lacipirellulaceae bacterium]
RPREPAMVRFFARSNPDEPLAGYEVFRIPAEGENPVLAGRTGADGVFAVYPGEQATTTLLLRSDGQVLAKLVVASGGSRVIEAPIADDRIRLAAQAEVQALREELIDVVARRTLMVAQVRKWLKEKDIDEARRTMAMLNELPTPTAFSNRLDSVAKSLPVSDDPRVRQTVEGLLTSTRELLSRFLDARTITSLQAEVNAASRAASDDLASGQ